MKCPALKTFKILNRGKKDINTIRTEAQKKNWLILKKNDNEDK